MAEQALAKIFQQVQASLTQDAAVSTSIHQPLTFTRIASCKGIDRKEARIRVHGAGTDQTTGARKCRVYLIS